VAGCNGEAIYGTTANPFEKLPFDGRCTVKGDTVYLHVFKRPESGTISLPTKARSATLLAGGEKLETRREGENLVIVLPASLPDPVATVIRVQ
jgi:alpha-L-fucosidase